MTEILGTVLKGRQRGKSIGFPTANIFLDAEIPEGIYISLTTIDTVEYPSLTFIGKAITYGEDTFQAETHLLNFDRDLYDRKIRVKLIKKLRDNEKFDSEDALVKQMERDKMQAEKYFNGIKGTKSIKSIKGRKNYESNE